jgi:hypothetical protein
MIRKSGHRFSEKIMLKTKGVDNLLIPLVGTVAAIAGTHPA